MTTTGHGFVRPPVGALPLHPDRTRPGEDGSGTVNSLGLITLALTLAFVLAGMGCAHTATVKLQAVADLAALAGAEHSASALWEDVGGRPCEAAAAVAAARKKQRNNPHQRYKVEIRNQSGLPLWSLIFLSLPDPAEAGQLMKSV